MVEQLHLVPAFTNASSSGEEALYTNCSPCLRHYLFRQLLPTYLEDTTVWHKAKALKNSIVFLSPLESCNLSAGSYNALVASRLCPYIMLLIEHFVNSILFSVSVP